MFANHDLALIYMPTLLCPSLQWRVAQSTNAFGDRFFTSAVGELLVTDLRVIFVPVEIYATDWGMSVKDRVGKSEYTFSAAETLAVQRYTFQLPLSSVKDCRVTELTGGVSGSALVAGGGANTGSGLSGRETLVGRESTRDSTGDRGVSSSGVLNEAWVLCLEGFDGSAVEFIVRRQQPQRRHRVLPLDELHSTRVRETAERLARPTYCAGVETHLVEPKVWCLRVQEYVLWEARQDIVWVRWAKALRDSCALLSGRDRAWVKHARVPVDLDADYQRLRVQDLDWRLSDLNSGYALCPSYPSVLVFPGALSDDEICGASMDRSKRRLPVMVWLHPHSKTPLCRASQPLSGMTGNNIEQDKRLLLSIKNSCPTGRPLRIADARPKLNANANAMHGKGFENVSFLGGACVASIIFMDIDNIHVMRQSLAKLRECLPRSTYCSSAGAESEGADTVHASKWVSHVSSVLRGAVGIADSLMLGHPTIVHCSDGWDRTAQLSALAQVLLDPYYRTIEGFLALLKKEWCAFGHKFEDRLGRGAAKEASPVCLQFLDAVWQVVRQYPTQFEFSPHFAVFLVQALYSGLFVDFRGNNQRERHQMMRNVGSYEEMAADDFDFSTLSCYVNLLRNSSMGPLLTNQYYTPPTPEQRLLHYLRPSYALHDLALWRDGLGSFSVNNHSPPALSLLEASAMQHDLHSRCLGYLDLHLHSMPAKLQQQLEIIKSADYANYCPHSSMWTRPRISSHLIPANRESRLIRSVFPSVNAFTIGSQFDAAHTPTMERERAAATRVQIWARTVQLTARALGVWVGLAEGCSGTVGAGAVPADGDESRGGKAGVGAAPAAEGLDSSSVTRVSASEVGCPGALKCTLSILAAAHLKSQIRAKLQLHLAHSLFVASVVSEVVEEALLYALRTDHYNVAYAHRRSVVPDSTTHSRGPLIGKLEAFAGAGLGGGAFTIPHTSTEGHSPVAKKTLSSRIFGGFGSSKEGKEGKDRSVSGSAEPTYRTIKGDTDCVLVNLDEDGVGGGGVGGVGGGAEALSSPAETFAPLAEQPLDPHLASTPDTDTGSSSTHTDNNGHSAASSLFRKPSIMERLRGNAAGGATKS
ncbi:Myotubularin-like phosphatase domain-containing protein [Ochromonadaceae sp. CCMP2298]|nr:Myotubularin-like phosphatase domain-containing protein [Ochromonadaceae sp. CCMP2298]